MRPYPSGTGTGPFLTWNAGGLKGKWAENKADDVTFIDKLLDDLTALVNVDEKRVFACGMSNGGMMCYRLAAELSERIAAIAPVAGTIATEETQPKRPVSVIHFHGTNDKLVPFGTTNPRSSKFMKLMGVEESVQTWVRINKCEETPQAESLTKDDSEMKVIRKTYSNGQDGAEVVLVTIEGGGHTWPGKKSPIGLIGKSTTDVSANNLMWEFFQKHPMK